MVEDTFEEDFLDRGEVEKLKLTTINKAPNVEFTQR